MTNSNDILPNRVIDSKIINGNRFFFRKNTNDLKVVQNAQSTKTYKIEDMDFKYNVAIDIGTHIGSFINRVKQRFPKATVEGFEVLNESYQLALKNTKVFDNVTVHNKAVIGEEEPVGITHRRGKKLPEDKIEHNAGGYRVSYEKSLNHRELDCDGFISINDILDKYDGIDVMKVDCEGCEYPIFSTITTENLKKIKRICMELHNTFFVDSGCSKQGFDVVCEDDIMKLLEDNGFEQDYYHKDNVRSYVRYTRKD